MKEPEDRDEDQELQLNHFRAQVLRKYRESIDQNPCCHSEGLTPWHRSGESRHGEGTNEEARRSGRGPGAATCIVVSTNTPVTSKSLSCASIEKVSRKYRSKSMLSF
jgi:hypothetical protein